MQRLVQHKYLCSVVQSPLNLPFYSFLIHFYVKLFLQAYVDDYLEDFKFELTPKTYKRRRKPEWLIKELIERDVQVIHSFDFGMKLYYQAHNQMVFYLCLPSYYAFQVARRKHMNNTNMLTNEPLIRESESVEEFVKRTWR